MPTYRKILAAAFVLICGLGALAADKRREICFPDVPGYLTLKCDFHMHTVFSDGEVWPTVRVDEAWRQGLDAITITDHVEYRPHKDDISGNLNRPYEIARVSARQHDILLIRGAELTHATPPGHFNAIFLSDVQPLDIKDFDAQFSEASRQGAFVFWNHPGWKGPERGQWGEKQTWLFEQGILKGIEICNGDSYYGDAHRWATEKHLTLVGDSDVHGPLPTTPWKPEHHRTLTLVFAKERSLNGIHAALLDGRTAVWSQNKLYGREPELSALFEASVRVHPPHRRAGKTIWFRIHNACELDLDLERTGGAGPQQLRLPARSSILVRLRGTTSMPAGGMRYNVTNMLIGPDQPLPVRLTVSPPRQAPDDLPDLDEAEEELAPVSGDR